MTKSGIKKPRGKAFVKGEDSRRVVQNAGGKTATFTREMKACLLTAAENAGNRLVALSNARLPKKPTAKRTAELIELMRRDPEGSVSYFEWLAEFHPALFLALLGRALPMGVRGWQAPQAGDLHAAAARQILDCC